MADQDTLLDRVVAAIGGQYEVEEEIGRGGMSVVYRARDRRLNRTVAIKVLPPELAYDTAIRARFTREAQTAAQLAHAHIVPIFDVGELEGIAYLVMAHVTGGSLATLLAREPRQPVDEARRMMREVADALAYAHLRGVIHRDIKPDNILLDGESGRAMVTDFGIARAMEATSRLTATGNAVGTPAYMSPEQAVGERELDGRSDIYSLGVLGYQMITGRVPFTAGNSMALLMKHVSEPPRPIADLRPDTPRPLREAIERALMKSPEDRWPTAGALRDALGADSAGASWRAERREPVRVPYISPRRGTPAVERSAASAPARAPAGITLEPEHLAGLTPEQRTDLRLWHGRVHLLDRIKATRGYAVLTLGTIAAGLAAFVAGVEEGIPPLILAPAIPGYMMLKLWRRGRSLKRSGLKLLRVYLMPRAKWAIPGPKPAAAEQALAKLAPPEVLDSPHGAAVRRAVDEQAAILGLVDNLPPPDRALLPDLKPTVQALVERVAHLATALHRLDQSFDPRLRERLEAQLSLAERDASTPDGQRRLSLYQRQRATLDELSQRRDALAAQLDNAGLALGNLRLDLVKLGSSGMQSALADVSSATQEARALSREIGAVLDAAAEVKRL